MVLFAVKMYKVPRGRRPRLTADQKRQTTPVADCDRYFLRPKSTSPSAGKDRGYPCSATSENAEVAPPARCHWPRTTPARCRSRETKARLKVARTGRHSSSSNSPGRSTRCRAPAAISSARSRKPHVTPAERTPAAAAVSMSTPESPTYNTSSRAVPAVSYTHLTLPTSTHV